MIRNYLLAQDIKTMIECTKTYQTHLVTLAESQDRLGWDCFVEGRISTVFLQVTKQSLSAGKSQQTATNWCQKLVGHLLQITHKQWVFRNSQVHQKFQGCTQMQHNVIMDKMRSLMRIHPHSLLEKYRYLLQEDFERLGEGVPEERKQWIVAMESAVSAAEFVQSGNQYRGNPYSVRGRMQRSGNVSVTSLHTC